MRIVMAVDVGGVLADVRHSGDPMPNALTVLNILEQKGFEIHIVSQCGKQRAIQTKLWLRHHLFNIPSDRQHYVSFKQSKLPVLEKINANIFVDDRLKHIIPACPHISVPILFGSPPQHLVKDKIGWYRVADDWTLSFMVAENWLELFSLVSKPYW